jgi:hypothetical protein
MVQDLLMAKSKTLSDKQPNKAKDLGLWAQVVYYLPSRPEGLSSNTSTANLSVERQ